MEFWKSDGTTAGTVKLKDTYPSALTSVNGTLYFATGPNDIYGDIIDQELWKSDGTVAGTVLVKDICPGTCSSTPANLINVNGTLYFTAADGVNGTELWKSDGTTDGTIMVADINPGAASSSPANLTVSGDKLFFTADDGVHGAELWAVDLDLPPAPAAMTSPAAGSTLSGSSATFNWSASAGALQYWIWIGTIPGSMDIYAQGQGLNTAAVVNGLPTNGSAIHVRLFTMMPDGSWQWNDYTYTVASPSKAAMTSPSNGSTLSGSSATFNWSVGTGALQYWIWIGTTTGSMDIYAQGQGLNTSAVVTGLPTDGSAVHVRLFTMMQDGAWQWNDYTYTAAP
jgi:ELWxxDGT repeat protein